MSDVAIFALGCLTGATLIMLGAGAIFFTMGGDHDTPPPSPTPSRKNRTESELLAPVAQNRATIKFKKPQQIEYEKEKPKNDRIRELIGR